MIIFPDRVGYLRPSRDFFRVTCLQGQSMFRQQAARICEQTVV